MKKIASLLVLCFLVTACNQVPGKTVTVETLPIVTKEVPKPTSTSAPTLTPPGPTHDAPTQEYKEKKPYLIKYSYYAGDGTDEFYDCLGGYGPYPQFILYDDGRVILFTHGTFVETQITQMEIQQLLDDVIKTGVLEIDNSASDPREDKTYNIPEGVEIGEGGWGEELIVKGKKISINASLYEYVVEPVKEAITIINSFQPTEKTTPFIPTELEIYLTDTNSEYLKTNFNRPIPNTESINWPTEFPVPNFENGDYIDGFRVDHIQTINLVNRNVFRSFPAMELFRRGDIVYLVVACPRLDVWWD